MPFSDPYKALGWVIRNLRKRRGLSSQKALAEEVRRLFPRETFDMQTVSDIESGAVEDPRLRTVVKLANAMGVRPTTLFALAEARLKHHDKPADQFFSEFLERMEINATEGSTRRPGDPIELTWPTDKEVAHSQGSRRGDDSSLPTTDDAGRARLIAFLQQVSDQAGRLALELTLAAPEHRETDRAPRPARAPQGLRDRRVDSKNRRRQR